MNRVYVPKRLVRGALVIQVEHHAYPTGSVNVWKVEHAFAGRPREVTRWFSLVNDARQATAIAKALLLLIDEGQALDTGNLPSLLVALGFSGPCHAGDANHCEPPLVDGTKR